MNRPAIRAWAYVMSLVVLGAALWFPDTVMAQIAASGGGGGTFNGGSVTGATSFLDGSNFQIKNTADQTKIAQFDAALITTGTTRTYNLPNVAGGTLALVGSVVNNGGLYLGNGFEIGKFGDSVLVPLNATSTPDMFMFQTGTTSNAFVIAEAADAATDQQNGSCGSSTCANPQLTIMSGTAVSPQTQYNSQAFWGNAGEALKTLTESSATAIVQIPVAASAGTGGVLYYGIFAADATDQQLRQSSIRYSVTNKAATETCTITNMAGTAVTNETNDGNAASISTGTLTYAIACDTSPANAVNITFNAVSSLTQTTLQARYQVQQVGPGQVVPQ